MSFLEKINKDWRWAVPTAIVIMAAITFFYFKPLFSGKEINQGDIMRHKAMSKEIMDYRNKYHTDPLWTNSMFGGMPAYQISTEYSGNLLSTLDKVFKLFLPHPSGYLFLYGIGFFILLITLRMPLLLAIAGAISYALSSYFLIIIEAGHNSKANAIGYIPLVLAGMILLFKENKKWLGLSLSSIFWAMEINANHLQITYYLGILVFIFWAYWLYSAIKEKVLKDFFTKSILLGGAVIVSLLPNMGNLLCTYEYGKYSTRGKSELTITPELKSNKDTKTSGLDKDYATQWSYGIGETFTFLIPDFKGGASQSISKSDGNALSKVPAELKEVVANSSAYFGPQPFTSGPVYIGAIVIFLFIIGFFVLPKQWKVPLVIATTLSIMLAWGKNFMLLTDIFMDYVPGYNKFRAVSMILVIAEFTIPLMAALSLYYLTNPSLSKIKIGKKEIEPKKFLLIIFIIVGGFCLVNYLAPSVFNSFKAPDEEAIMTAEYVKAGYPKDEVRKYIAQIMPSIEDARQSIARSDAMRSFIFIALFFSFLWFYLQKKVSASLLFLSLGIFNVIDLYTVDKRYFGDSAFIDKQSAQSIFTPSSADEMILKDTTKYYRVLNLASNTFNDANTSYFHKSVGGYHGAKLKKYQEMIDFHLGKEIQDFYRLLNQISGNDSLLETKVLPSLQVINMLNTRYLILPVKGGEVPLTNNAANGNAWFVQNIITVTNADSEIVKLYSINTKIQAIIQEKNKLPDVSNSYDGKGRIVLTEYQPNYLKYQSTSDNNEFAVFSEIYYPKGWNAYIDGQKTNYTCVNYILRGMPISKGNHIIEFKFEPNSYYTGNKIAYAGSVIIYSILVSALYFIWKELKR